MTCWQEVAPGQEVELQGYTQARGVAVTVFLSVSPFSCQFLPSFPRQVLLSPFPCAPLANLDFHFLCCPPCTPRGGMLKKFDKKDEESGEFVAGPGTGEGQEVWEAKGDVLFSPLDLGAKEGGGAHLVVRPARFLPASFVRKLMWVSRSDLVYLQNGLWLQSRCLRSMIRSPLDVS